MTSGATLGISQENKQLLPYPPHLKNVSALPCKMHKFFIFFTFARKSSTNIHDTDELRKRLVVTWAEIQQSGWTLDDAVDHW